MTLAQDVDSIIAEDNINDSVPAVDLDGAEEDNNISVQSESENTNNDGGEGEESGSQSNEGSVETIDKESSDSSNSDTEDEDRSPSETIAEAKTLIQNLELTEDKIFNEDGSIKPWSDIVPAGAYLASQLNPVRVTDKDGKVHEFMLISDVEKAFPEGFEAKNNLEQLKFERAIMANETKFDEAIKTYESAQSRYEQETGSMAETRIYNQRIGAEYKAMADQGLVPKVGDPTDPKFNESDAVKELNGIMAWMAAKNAENSAKGLGKIDSLYVAKQLMDAEGAKVEKVDRKKQIIDERNEVASLSANAAPGGENKRPQHQDIPISRLADVIIAEEGLR